MTALLPVCFALAGIAIAFLFLGLALPVCLRAQWLVRSCDLHHTHQSMVPRLGGLALAVTFSAIELLIALLFPEQRATTPARNVVVVSSLAMFALGFWDDIRPLGARRKLLGQILIAASVCWFGLGVQVFKIPFTEHIVNLGVWGAPLTILWLVGLTNLINLIDGVDGLAGGICLMLMVLVAFVGSQSGNFAMLASGMAGALLGFLWFNFPPARVYLGDGGAYFLGFQIGLFSIINSHKGTIFAALLAPLFVLALPIVDTTLAIIRRGLRGLPIFRPDRRHIHHHLIGMGLSRMKVVLSLYAVTLVFLVMGFLAYWSRGHLVPVLLGLSAVILLFLAGQLRFSREWFSVGRVLGNSRAMRQQVQYAYCLMRLVEMEGGRNQTVDALWDDFVLAVRKLGFGSVKLNLGEVCRRWEAPDADVNAQSAIYSLKGGRFGVLEVRSPGPRAEGAPGACLQDAQTFTLISELLAETWARAAARWEKVNDRALSFAFGARPVADESAADWAIADPLPETIQAGATASGPRWKWANSILRRP
jgi:UDP-GlcNAc:undecaprenyl-phosphate/decaprenyl-phosphate GlcNAc-1-phosphate transferase